jgi:hypothetical protein
MASTWGEMRTVNLCCGSTSGGRNPTSEACKLSTREYGAGCLGDFFTSELRRIMNTGTCGEEKWGAPGKPSPITNRFHLLTIFLCFFDGENSSAPNLASSRRISRSILLLSSAESADRIVYWGQHECNKSGLYKYWPDRLQPLPKNSQIH